MIDGWNTKFPIKMVPFWGGQVLHNLVGGKTLAGTHLHDAFVSPMSAVAVNDDGSRMTTADVGEGQGWLGGVVK